MSPSPSSDDESPQQGRNHASSLRSRSNRKEAHDNSESSFSFFSSSRRKRTNNGSTNQSAILPMTTSNTNTADATIATPTVLYHSSRQQAASSSAATAATSNTCNSFLLGGNYYPGKDKKRRHMRKRTLWYRMFCSSPWRAALTVLVLAYIAVWHVVLPFTAWIFYYGTLLSSSSVKTTMSAGESNTAAVAGQSGEEWLSKHYHLPFRLPVLEDERAAVQDLVLQRLALRPQLEKARQRILLQIVPSWVHRNEQSADEQQKQRIIQDEKKEIIDTLADKESENKLQQQEKVRKLHDETNFNPSDPQEGKQQPQQQQNEQNSPLDPRLHIEKRPTPAEAVQWHLPSLARPLRTLQSMETFPNDSKCSDSATENIHVSLVVQASLDRVWVLDETCRRWKDPIVAVVGLTIAEQKDDVSAALAGWKDKCPQLQLILHKLDEQQARPEMYPVNHLRNVALDAVETSHILAVDVDFVPSDNLYDTITSVLKERQELRLQADARGIKAPGEESDALVVPAFERVLVPPCVNDEECKQHLRENSSFLPHTFEELKDCVGKKDCIVFQSDNNWEGHFSTRSNEWLQGDWYEGGEDLPRIIKPVQCFHTLRYEPYVVLRWCPAAASSGKGEGANGVGMETSKSRPVAPYYDERFHGYGKNKIEYISHLRIMGYQFSILPRGFIIHNPHVESKAKELWKDVAASDLHASMDQLYPQFLHELVEMYHDRRNSIVQPCQL